MRYVIIIFSIAFFIIWESVFTGWSTSQAVLDELYRLRALLTR